MKIFEFSAEIINFAQQPEGVLLTASGKMLAQDTALVESVVAQTPVLSVTIEKEGEQVLDARFEVTFFTLEAQELAVLLKAV